MDDDQTWPRRIPLRRREPERSAEDILLDRLRAAGLTSVATTRAQIERVGVGTLVAQAQAAIRLGDE